MLVTSDDDDEDGGLGDGGDDDANGFGIAPVDELGGACKFDDDGDADDENEDAYGFDDDGKNIGVSDIDVEVADNTDDEVGIAPVFMICGETTVVGGCTVNEENAINP